MFLPAHHNPPEHHNLPAHLYYLPAHLYYLPAHHNHHLMQICCMHSWLFEEVNPSLICSESEGKETNDNLSSACGTKVDLTEILGQLIQKISHSNVWEEGFRSTLKPLNFVQDVISMAHKIWYLVFLY